MSLLNESSINIKLQNLKGWNYSDNQIEKVFSLNNFVGVVSVVNTIAEIAESMDHHPDLLIHSYKKLKVMISSHSEGGVTEKDFMLAERIERLF